MNKRQMIVIFCLFAVFFSALSIASATDVDNTTVSVANNQNTINMANDNGEVLGDSPGTFSELDGEIQSGSSGDIIPLSRNYTYSGTTSQAIAISTDITIDGQGYTLNAEGKIAIFNINSNSHVILKNIRFINGYGVNGSAIKVDSGSSVEILNCTFINNTATNFGGAIYSVANTSTVTSKITNSIFENNSALNGGAIYMSSNNAAIEGTTFTSNNATNDGAALYFAGDYCNLANSTFTDNVAGDDGPAIYWQGSNGIIYNISCSGNRGISGIDPRDGSRSTSKGGTICLTGSNVTISKSNFSDSLAGFDGGALFITGNGVKVIDTVFYNCTARDEHGGVLYIIGNYTTVENCDFERCNANLSGGVIYVIGHDVIINQANFTENGANLDGAALYVAGDNCTLSNSTFSNNTAGDDGGAVYWEGNNGIIYNITCTNNRGISDIDPVDKDQSNSKGGTICLTGSNVTIEKSSFIQSSVVVDGGALFITGNNVSVVDCLFDNCTSTNSSGGALYIIGNDANILDCNFKDCSAYLSGGVIYVEGDGASIDNATFIGNGANLDGAALFIAGDNCTLSNSIFTDNVAGDDGGAIYWEGDNGIIYNITCTNNKGISGIDPIDKDQSNSKGGTICLTGSNVTVNKSSFIQSSVVVDGGALFITGNDVNVIDTTFVNCSAGNDGGALYIIGNDTVVSNCTFTKANATDGGAIYLSGDKITLIDSSSKDTSASNGGAIFIAGNDVLISNFESTLSDATIRGGSIYVEGDKVNIFNSTITNTNALIGGAIYISGNDTVVDESSFAHNTGSDEGENSGSGGAIYIDGDTATIKNSDFNYDSAVNYGGAIAVWGAKANITNNTFDNCTTSKFNGGAIYVAGDDATISLSNFTKNQVNRENFAHGGSIDIEGDRASVLDCHFTDSDAYLGGIIYVSGDDAIIDNSTFQKGTAIDGGAIYMAGTNASILKSNFTQLNADLLGGAIYVEGNSTNIDYCNFSTCNVKYYHGGAIYIAGVKTVINNSDFTLCNALGTESRGGAINVEGNDTSIYNSNFDENRATTGGAIYVFGHRALIDNSSFEKDTSNNGGAIYVLGWGTSIVDSDILDCNATLNGGGIYIEGGGTLINSTSFGKCNSLRGAGGSIYIAGSYTNIDGSNFTESIASTDGGAILVAGDYVNIDESSFEKCVAKGTTLTSGGGAIYITGREARISESNFTDNKVTSNSACGGTIYIEGYKATIEESNFNNSRALNQGGVIFIIGEEAKIDSSTLSNSSSRNSGGAIYVNGNNTTIIGSDFANITSNAHGGAIYIAGAYTDIDESSFYNCTVTGLAAGGAIYINDVGTTVSYSNFTKSFANSAGAISINGENTTIDHCNVYNNSASDSAGAIHVLGDNTILAYNNFTNNFALKGDGGALDIGGQNASVYYSIFDHNDARENGGAINWIGGHGADSIVGCSFTNNVCHGTGKGGGAIYWTAGDGDITAGGLIKDSVFINNSAASRHGGAIDWFHALDSVFDNCTFINNSATCDGGALYTGDQKGGGVNLTIINSRFYNNTAGLHGGAIANQMTGSLIYNCTFDNNRAGQSGGTILMKEGPADNSIIDHCNITNSQVLLAGDRWGAGGGSISIGENDDNITISNCIIINSTVHNRFGGSVAVRSVNSSIINVTIINSTTLNEGSGSIHWSGAYGTLENVTIVNSSSRNIDNTKDANGGAVFWSGSYGSLNNLTVVNTSTYRNNTGGTRAANGGAVYITGTNVNLTNCEIVNTSASALNGCSNGGAIYWNGANGMMDNISVTNSTTLGSSGGAIYMFSNGCTAYNVNITNSTLNETNRNYDVNGGAIFWNSANSKLENISISNSALYYSFADGNKESRGGAIFINNIQVDANNINIDNSSIIADNGKGYGGAIYRSALWTAGQGSLTNATIYNSNLKGANGGAIAWYSGGATINNITIINSSVTSLANFDANGGAIFWNGGAITLEDIYISNSSVNYNHVSGTKESNGGAIFINSANVKLVNVTVDNSSAIADNGKAHGGAIYDKQSYCALVNSSLSNTFANGQGGAIFWTGGYATIENVTIVNSSTHVENTTFNANGGAIYTSLASLQNIRIINSSARDNKSVYGGAIYYTGNNLNNVTVINSSAISDSEISYGGAVYWAASNIKTIINSSFVNGTADYGGAVYRVNGGLNVYNTSFKNNTANISGGGIYARGGTVNFYNASFINNKANDSGGAVYAFSIYCHFHDSTLENNTAGYGGAIYYYNHPTQARSTIENTVIINNTAIQGSAIYANRLLCNFENVILLDNQAHAMEFSDVTVGVDETGTKYLSAIFKGYDNLLNAIWDDATTKYYSFTNVTYWGVNGRNVTGNRVTPQKSNQEVWINITVDLFDKDGNFINRTVVVTDADGRFKYTYEADSESNNSFKFYHLEDRYYTYIENTTSNTTIVKIIVDDIFIGENATVKLNLTDGAWTKLSGNVTVTFNDTKNTTIVIEVINGTGYCNNVSGLEVGTYRAVANYTGDLNHLGDVDWYTFRVIPIIDLDIDKKINVTNRYVNVSDIIKYTINVTNHGPSNATGVNVSEVLSEYLKLNNTNASHGYYNETGGYWYIGNLNRNETAILEITAQVIHVGTISNFVFVSGNEGEWDYTNNNATAQNVTALPIVDVVITKAINVTTSTVNVTDIIEFTINVHNNGPCNASGVYVNETLCSNLKLISATTNVGDYDGTTWIIGDLNTTFTATLTIVAQIISNGTVSNVVTVLAAENDTNMSNNKANITNRTALNIVDLTVTKVANTTGPVNVTDFIKFTITVHNNGPCDATGVNVTEVLSSHLKLTSNVTEYGHYDVNKGIWYIGNLNNGSTAVLTIVAEVISNGTIANAVVVVSNENDTNKSDNEDNITNITALNIVDLSITKEANTTGPVNVTDYVKFTIKVHNNGPCDATNVNVTEVLSPHLKLESAMISSGHGYYDVKKGVWYIGNLANQSTAVLTIEAKVISNGTIANVVVVTSSENDTDKSNNEANITNITALPIVDVSVNKTVNVTTSSLNFTDKLEFTIVIHNAGPCNATGVYVSEILDPSLVLISYNATRGVYDKFSWTGIDTLNVGQTETLTIIAQVAFSGEIDNEVIVYSYENDTDYTNNRDNISQIQVSTDVDLEIEKHASTAGPVNVTDTITFYITVHNISPNNASGVFVDEILDSHLRIISNTTSNGRYDGYTWNIGNLEGHGYATLTIVAEVISAGNISNAVSVKGYDNDTDPSNNNASVPNITALPIVDLQVTKWVNVSGFINVDDYVKFVVTVHNNGPCDATNVNVTEVLSSHLKLTNNVTEYGYYDVGDGVWHVGSLANQSTAVLTIEAKVISNGTIANVVVVTSTENDTNKSNNKANITNLTALPIVDLTITKAVNTTGPVNVTDYIKYTINVTNYGPSNATGVNVSEALSEYLNLTNAHPSHGYYNETGGYWYIGDLNKNETATLEIVAQIIHMGTISNFVFVFGNENETDYTNNNDTAKNVTALPIVDVVINKAVNTTGPVNVTDYIEFTITVYNNGPCNASGVYVGETLSSHLKMISATTNIGDFDGSTWIIGDLNTTFTAKLTIVAQVISNGTISNVVTVTPSENDTNRSNNRANITNITALPIVDLTVSKEVNVSSYVNVSDYVKFTITVHNNGPSDATGVNVTEVLSSHLKLTSNVTEYGHYDVGDGVWYIGNLANQSTAVLTIVAKVISNGTIANVVVVESNENDTNKSNNNDTIDNITSLPVVDLNITKAVNTTGPVNVTDYIKFTITVHNNGPCDATGVNVTEVLSPHLKFESADVSGGHGHYDVGDGVWYIGNLANQSTAVLTIVAKVISNGTIANVVVVESNENDTNKSNNENNITNITALAIVDLSINKTVNVTTSSLNFTDKIEFTIVIHNAGPCNATGVYVSEMLDSSLVLISYNATKGTYDGYTWKGIDRLNVGDNETLTIVAQVAFSGEIDNEVIVYSYEKDTNYTNNRDNISQIVVSTDVDLEIHKHVSTAGPVNVSDRITFNIIVHNISPNNASGVFVDEILDSHLRLISNITSRGSYDGYTWNIGNLEGHGYATLIIIAEVISAGNISNAVVVDGYDNDTDPSNNNASIPNITALPIVDLNVTKKVNVSGFVNVTDLIKFTITVHNNGPCNATGVNVTEVLSPHLRMISNATDYGYYNKTAGIWYIGTLNNQSTAVLTIIAEVISNGTIANAVVVKSNENDTDKSNNNDTIDNITSFNIVDLNITKVVNPSGNANVTDVIEFTITVFNNGPCNATNVNVSEVLSSHLKLLDNVTKHGYYNVSEGIWHIGNLANQSSVNLTITAKVISAGTIENVVVVSSKENDTNMSNNKDKVVFEAFPIVDVKVNKTVNVTSRDVEVTDVIKFTVTVSNAGPCNATEVYVDEVLDSALTMLNYTATKGTYDGFVWKDIGNLNVGENATLIIVARVDNSGIIENEAIVHSRENDTNTSNNRDKIPPLNSTAYVDLEIAKKVNVSGFVNVTDYIEFTVTVKNNGPCNASDVLVREVLDSHLTLVSYNATKGTYDGVKWDIGNLKNNENATLKIIAQVTSKGIISNVVVVNSTFKDSNESNNNDSIENITALPIVDLEITKRINVGEHVNVTDVIEYTVTVRNNGPCDATNVMVSEVLSEHLNMTDYLASRGRYNVTSGIWTIGNLAKQTSVFMIVRAQVISNGTIENVVRVNSTENDTNPDNNVANVTIEAFTIVDLSITKQVNVTTGEVEITDKIKFTLTVHNAGPCNATNVYIKEALDTALRLVNWTASKQDKFGYDGYTWVIGNMSVGDTETLEVIAEVVYSGIITNEVIVRCNDNDTDFSNNIANIDPIVSSAHVDLEISKKVNASGSVNVSDLIEFTVTVHNRGPCNASGVFVLEVIDDNLEMKSYNATHGDYDGYTWNVGYLNYDETANLTIVAKVISDGIISNEVVVDGFDNDTNKSNNVASIDNITALPIVDLEISKRVDMDGKIAKINDIIQFTITVKNNGPSAATNVNVSEVLSPHLEMITYLTWLGYYDVDNGVWYIGDLANQESVDLIIQAKVISNGTITNVVGVNSTENDTNKSNNHDSIDNITAIPIVDLEVDKQTNATDYIEVNDLVEFIITVRNNGPSNATNVNVTEVLSPYLKLLKINTETGYYNKTNNVWYVGNLSVDSEAILNITAQVLSDGLISNYIIADSFENDTNPYNNWDEVYVGVLPLVDLSISKTTNVSGNVSVTNYIEFVITVHNAGPSNATGVFVEEGLSQHLELVSYNATVGSYDGYTWDIGSLNNGSTVILTIIAKVISEGIIENGVVVSGFDIDINESNNRDNITPINSTEFVDLSITKWVNVTGFVNITDKVKFVITVRNDGPCNATGVFVSEPLNINLGEDYYYNTTDGSTYDGYTWVIGNLTKGASVTLTIIANVTSVGIISNSVVVNGTEKDRNTSNNVANITNITVLPIVDVKVNKTVNVDVVDVGDLVEYTINVVNMGPCDATDVNVTEHLSPFVEFVSARSWIGTYDNLTNIWNIPTLYKNVPVSLVLTVRVISNGTIENIVTVTSHENDTNKSNNGNSSDNVTARPLVDVKINKTVNATLVNVTNLVEYTINVVNIGPSNATGVVVFDKLDSHLKFVSFDSSRSAITYDDVTGECIVGSLNVNETVILTLVARVISTGTIANTANVTSNENDTNKSNNKNSSDNVTALPIVDIKLNKTVNAVLVNVTDIVEFTIVVTNDGPCNATSVVVFDKLDSHLKFVSFDASRGGISYDDVTGECIVGNLNVNESVVLTVVARVLSNGTIPNTANATSAENDTNKSNNKDSSDNITALPIVDVKVTKTVDVWEVHLGDLIKYTISVANSGPSDATGVNVTDKLSSMLEFVSFEASRGGISYDNKTGISTIGNLNADETVILTITARAVLNGTVENVVFVKSNENDTNMTNNNDTSENVTVDKLSTPINIYAYDITYGDDEILTVTLPGEATGTVNITVGNRTYNDLAINHGIVLLPVIDLAGGNYTVNVVYGGDEVYVGNSTSAIFNVARAVPIITIEVEDIWVGEIEILNVTVNAPGVVYVTVYGHTVVIPLENGVVTTDVLAATKHDYKGNATWNIINLPVGAYPAFALYPGNENYTRVNTTDLFHVRDKQSTVVVTADDIYVGEDAVINIKVGPTGLTGNVTVTLEGETYIVELDNNSEAVLVVSGLKAGIKKVKVEYNGTALYRPSENTTTFNVAKLKPPVEIEAPEITVGEDGVITVYVPEDATGTITIEIEGKRYTADVENGKAVFKVPGLKAGVHDIVAYYSGDEKYLSANSTGSIKVNPLDENKTDNHTTVHVGGICLAQYATGNPIFALLAIIASICFVQIRRFKR